MLNKKRNSLRSFLVQFFILGFAGLSRSAFPCDTFVALQGSTIDGSVILAKNSDRPPMEAQPLVHFARMNHGKDEKVKCTYIEIPQASVTYEHLGSKIWWAFGYEQGMNEYGVAIGNEAVWSKEPYQWGDGLLGMDLLRLGLERGGTAYEAMHVIIDLLQRFGQSGDCEYPNEWGKANYHNSFIIADPKEAWVLETAGRYWVAKRITHGVYSISNIYTIEQDWNEAHSSLVQHAIDMGWTKSPKTFNFARDYGDYWKKGSPDPGIMQIRRNASLSLCQRVNGQISSAIMMRFLRDHHEGTIVESRWSPPESFWATLCLHDSPRFGYHSAASAVFHLRAWMPPLLRQVYWSSFSNPCSNIFKPFYLHGPKVPANYSEGTSTYSANSPWWWANQVKLLCDLSYGVLNPMVRGVFDETEKWILERREQHEFQALDLIKNEEESAAVKLLQHYIDENSKRISEEYKMLNEKLPQTLERVGIKYIFVDYLRAWSVKQGVPLAFR